MTPRGGPAIADGALGRARRLQQIAESIHSLEASATVDDCLRRILAIGADDFRFHGAIACIEATGGALALSQHAAGAAHDQITFATERAHAFHAWLRAPGKAPRPTRFDRDQALRYVVVPIASRHLALLGSLQLEAAGPVEEIDVGYACALAIQMALAIEHARVVTSLDARELELTAERTARITAEIALADLQVSAWSAEWLARRFRLLLASLPSAFVWEAHAGNLELTYVGENVLSVTGSSAGGLLSKGASLLELLETTSRGTVSRTCREASVNAAARSCRHSIHTASGEAVAALTVVGPAPEAPGRLLGVSVRLDAAGDLTEPQHAAARPRDLFDLVAHELRAPLEAVLLGVAALKDRRPAKSDGEQAVFAAIDRSTRTIHRLVDDILDSAALETGQLSLHLMPTRVRAMLDHLTAAPPAQLAELRVALRLDAFVGDPWVVCDPMRLHQVLTNLVVNAAKVTPPEGTVSISAGRLGNHVVLSVSDTGPGISPELIPHLFDRFRRGDSSTPGIDLGLHLSKAIVSRHGGNIWVRSVLGEGSTFSFALPAWPPETTT